MARDTNQIMGHGADNDGIEEYDNPLPDWWTGLFLVTIVGGIAYAVNYHFISHDSQAAYYDAEFRKGHTILVVQPGDRAQLVQTILAAHNARSREFITSGTLADQIEQRHL